MRGALTVLLVVLLLASSAAAQTATIRTAPKGSTGAGLPTSTGINANTQGLDVNIVGGGGSGGTASNFGAAFPAVGTAAGFKDNAGNMAGGNLDAGGRLIVNCGSGCAGAAGDGTATGALNANNATVVIALSSYSGANVDFTSGGTLVGTVVAEGSNDGGVTYPFSVWFLHPATGVLSASLTNPASGDYSFGWAGSLSHVRVRVSAFTSGSTTGNLRTTATNTLSVLVGSDGTNLRVLSTTTGGLLKVDLSGTGANATALKVDGSAVTQPVSGTVTANQGGAPWSANITQFGGTNLSTGTGAGGAGIPRVTISNDSSLAANQSVNVSQFGGTNVVTGTGASGAGIPRVTVANDSTIILGAGAATIGALTANQSVNVAQIAGAATATAASGVQKVGITGNAGAAMDAAGQNATSPANELLVGGQFNTTPTTITTGNISPLQLDSTGSLKVNCLTGCASSADTTTASTALGSNGATITIALAGQIGVAFQLQSGGTGVYTVTPQCSFDGGTLYNTNGYLQDPVTGAVSLTATIASGQATTDYPVMCPQGSSHAQIKVTSYTSGTANWLARATATSWPPVMWGVVTTSAPSYTTGTINTFSLQTDGSVRAAITNTPTVTANAGTNLNTSALALDTSVNGLLLSQGSTTSGQKGPLMQGAVTTAAPTYTTAQSDPLSLTTGGALRGDITTIAGTAPSTAGKLDVKGADGDVFVRQATAANLNAQAQGAAASGAAKAGNPVQVGGVFNTTQPTVTTGQAVEAQATARGALIVAPGVDGFAVTGTVTTTPPANASTNVAQFGGTNLSTGTGAGGAGIPRVTLSNDSSLAANQSVNVAQVNGVTTQTGVGASGTGTQRVVTATDSTIGTLTSITNTVTVAGAKTNNNAAPGATNVGTLPGVATNVAPTYVEGNQVALSTDLTGALRVAGGGGLSVTDSASWTAAASAFTPAGGEYNPTAAPLVSGQQGTLALTANRAVQDNLRNSYGQEIGVASPTGAALNSPPLVVALAPAFPATPANPLRRGVTGLSTGTSGTPIATPVQTVQVAGAVASNGAMPFTRCDKSAAINTAASGFTELVSLVGNKSIYVCGYTFVSTSALSVKFSYGTGSACATGTVDLTGAMAVAANGGVVNPVEATPVFELPAGQAFCINLSGATQVSGHIKYTQF